MRRIFTEFYIMSQSLYAWNLVKTGPAKTGPAGPLPPALYMVYHSARNKDQKLVGQFFEDTIFYRLLIAVPLKMYRKFGKIGRKMANCYF